MADYFPRQAQVWHPESAFSIDLNGTFTCIGYAPSRKRRCHNPIACHNQNAARDILNELSHMDPLDVASAENRTGQLKKAAGYALCRRYHQNQANDIVREWKRILREEVPRRPERRRGESPEERAASRNHRRSASHADSVMAPLSTFPSPPSTSSSTRSRSGSQEPRQQNDRHNRPSRQLDRGDDQLAELRRTVEEVVRQNEEFMREREEMTRGIEEMVRLIEDLLAAQRRSPSVRTRERQRQSVVAREVVEVPEWEPEPESEPESETEPEPEPEPANQQTCTATHQLRRSVDEDCVICTMPMVNSPLSELVWCKNSCGQSVHKQCFETMGQHTQVVRCVFCRTNWADSCEHDEQRPDKFEIWADWEWGLDLLFDQSV